MYLDSHLSTGWFMYDIYSYEYSSIIADLHAGVYLRKHNCIVTISVQRVIVINLIDITEEYLTLLSDLVLCYQRLSRLCSALP